MFQVGIVPSGGLGYSHSAMHSGYSDLVVPQFRDGGYSVIARNIYTDSALLDSRSVVERVKD